MPDCLSCVGCFSERQATLKLNPASSSIQSNPRGNQAPHPHTGPATTRFNSVQPPQSQIPPVSTPPKGHPPLCVQESRLSLYSLICSNDASIPETPDTTHPVPPVSAPSSTDQAWITVWLRFLQRFCGRCKNLYRGGVPPSI